MWCLTNLCSKESTYCDIVIDAGGLEMLTFLLDCQSEACLEQTAWCLGNMAQNGTEYTQKIYTKGGLLKLFTCLSNSKADSSLAKTLAWVCFTMVNEKLEIDEADVVPAHKLL